MHYEELTKIFDIQNYMAVTIVLLTLFNSVARGIQCGLKLLRGVCYVVYTTRRQP